MNEVDIEIDSRRAWIIWAGAHRELSRLPSPATLEGRVAVFLSKKDAESEMEGIEPPGEIIEGTVSHFLSKAGERHAFAGPYKGIVIIQPIEVSP